MVFRKYKGRALNEKDVSHPPPFISEYKANIVFIWKYDAVIAGLVKPEELIGL